MSRRKTRNITRHPAPALPAHTKFEGRRRFRKLIEARAAEGCARHQTLLQWAQEGRL